MAIAELKNENSPRDKGLATITEVARYLRLSRSKVYGMMDCGQLCHVKIGRSRRVPWNAVMRLVEENTVGK